MCRHSLLLIGVTFWGLTFWKKPKCPLKCRILRLGQKWVIYFQNAVRPQVFVGGLCSSCDSYWGHHDVWDNRVFDPFTWVSAILCVCISHLKFCAVMVVIEENTVPKMILEYLCMKYMSCTNRQFMWLLSEPLYTCTCILKCSTEKQYHNLLPHTHTHTHTHTRGTSCSTEKALSEARESLEEIRKEMQAWRTQHEATHRKLKTEQAANSTIRVYAHCMSYTTLLTVGHSQVIYRSIGMLFFCLQVSVSRATCILFDYQ